MNFAYDEVVSNIERGFARFWPIYEDYAIIDGRLCHQGTEKYFYAPIVHTEIANELSKLNRGDEESVLRFARTYGSLGYQRLLPPASGLWKLIGDPLSWIWAHAETIRFCLLLSELLQKNNIDGLACVLRTCHVTPEDVEALCNPEQVQEISYARHAAAKYDAHPSYQLGGKLWHPTILVAERERVFLSYNLPGKNVHKNAALMEYGTRVFRSWVINANIQGVVRELKVRSRRVIQKLSQQPHQRHDLKKERSYWVFTALIETAYWHLANLIDGGTVKRCEDCSAIFIQRDRRQRFCPPSYNPKSSSRQHSRCGTRKRVREFRNPAVRC
jgi:hypothetical protein